ncbi:MAG: peptidoglycan binding domain-containing protein [Aerococcaceae bacterium]|nr:peptidoglycan binding domain-containing protein [Aerococcaceae bacterium]
MKKWLGMPRVRYSIASLLALIGIYLIGVLYFQSHFLPNRALNQQRIGGMSVASANEHLEKQLASYQIELVESEKSYGVLQLNDLNAKVELKTELERLLNEQSAFSWPLALFGTFSSSADLEKRLTFDEAMLGGLQQALGIDNQKRQEAVPATLVRDEAKGYFIQPEVYGQQVDNQSLSAALARAFFNQERVFDLKQAYIQPKQIATDKTLLDQFNAIEKIQQTQITLTFDGQTLTLPKSAIASWIVVSDSGEISVDETLIQEYLSGVNREYASVFRRREFQSTYQGLVTVEPGTYGWYINTKDEASAIKEDLVAQRNATREPSIGGTGYGLAQDIGSSYVEVDITNQTMFIYLDGELVFQTAVVTGQSGAPTVPGAYQVWNKESPSILTGYDHVHNRDYEQPVDYWIAFDDTGQGIHDAKWQPYFGGTAYLENGSLGCVNTPPALMGEVFDLVYYGMPVIVY